MTVAVALQFPVEAVTVYVVVTKGMATGLLTFGLVRFVEGLQLYIAPPDAFNGTALPAQIVVSA